MIAERKKLGSWFGIVSLLLCISLWLMLIVPPFRPFFGRHAVPQIVVQLTASVLLSLIAGFLQSRKWWLLTVVAAVSLAVLLFGMHSS